ncbi:MAG: efflux RND transporter periplasmic adaptor subunit [Bacteroidales bacterium]
MSQDNTRKNLLVGLGALAGVIIILALIGYLVSKPEKIILQGEAEATEYRISGKIPGRIQAYAFKEGDKVKAGDTLVFIESPELIAKLVQANAAVAAAKAMNSKAENGAREEQITGAFELWQKAKVARDVYEKSFNRINNLYKKEVVSAQKKDEIEAKYKAAEATEKAAKSQYDMAMKGARKEDKAAALALVARAEGAVQEVNSYMKETTLTAPCDGEISEIYHHNGELVGTGSPILSLVDLKDIWVVFNIREDLLNNITMGSTLEIMIPALSQTNTYKVKVTYLKSMASYATWRATKVNGQFDAKTFEVHAVPVKDIPNLRPGMSTIIKTILK